MSYPRPSVQVPPGAGTQLFQIDIEVRYFKGPRSTPWVEWICVGDMEGTVDSCATGHRMILIKPPVLLPPELGEPGDEIRDYVTHAELTKADPAMRDEDDEDEDEEFNNLINLDHGWFARLHARVDEEAQYPGISHNWGLTRKTTFTFYMELNVARGNTTNVSSFSPLELRPMRMKSREIIDNILDTQVLFIFIKLYGMMLLNITAQPDYSDYSVETGKARLPHISSRSAGSKITSYWIPRNQIFGNSRISYEDTAEGRGWRLQDDSGNFTNESTKPWSHMPLPTTQPVQPAQPGGGYKRNRYKTKRVKRTKKYRKKTKRIRKNKYKTKKYRQNTKRIRKNKFRTKRT